MKSNDSHAEDTSLYLETLGGVEAELKRDSDGDLYFGITNGERTIATYFTDIQAVQIRAWLMRNFP